MSLPQNVVQPQDALLLPDPGLIARIKVDIEYLTLRAATTLANLYFSRSKWRFLSKDFLHCLEHYGAVHRLSRCYFHKKRKTHHPRCVHHPKFKMERCVQNFKTAYSSDDTWCSESETPWNPDDFLVNWAESPEIPAVTTEPAKDNPRSFGQCIQRAFKLPLIDDYRYLALGSTSLSQADRVVNAKRKNGLHDWYTAYAPIYPNGELITAYTDAFSPSKSMQKRINRHAKTALEQHDPLARDIWPYLQSKLHVPPKSTHLLLGPKDGRVHINPYYDFWKYSCEELEWAGPRPDTVSIEHAHHILPVLYHHFGCVCPSYQALWVIAKLAQPSKPAKNKPVRVIFDIGSGTGYWTRMLRELSQSLPPDMKKLEIQAVDSKTSTFRTMWISDTIEQDGVEYLKTESKPDSILLLVYPQTGEGLTEKFLRAFNGEIVVVAGTQNGNGFTGFPDAVIDDWMSENMPEFELVLRIPLPSFAGKDDALFAFRRTRSENEESDSLFIP